MPALVICAVIAAFIAFLCIRAALFRPAGIARAETVPVTVDAMAAAEHLARLIRIRTVNHLDPAQRETAEWEKFIDALTGLYPLTHRTLTRERIEDHALLYRWKGRERGEPVVLMSHYDVVPAPAEGWTHPPFDGLIADGAVWGRGALDTKSTLVCILESVERLIGEGATPRRDIYLSFGPDEEVFGSGARVIAEHLQSRGIAPGLVVDEGGAVVEGVFPGVKRPAALIGVAEKGVANIGLAVASAGGHASMPPARQSAGRLARAILRLERRPFPKSFTAPTREMLTTLGRHAPFAFRLVFANLWLFSPLLLRLFTRLSAETNAMCRTTVAITMLEGAPATNVLPARVRAVANTRINIGETVESVVRRMERTIGDPSVDVRVITPGPPSPVSMTSGPSWERMVRAVQETYPDAIVSPYVVMGATDSRHFCGIAKNVYRFSPFPMSKAERTSMHGVNEAIPIASLGKGVEFYLRLIRGL